MKTIFLTFLLALLVCPGCSCRKAPHIPSRKAPYIPNGLSQEKLSVKNRNIVETQSKRIKKELATLQGHSWAGSYHREYPKGYWGSGAYLDISPNTGFTYTVHSNDQIDDYGPVLYDQNYGNVIWESGRLKLSPVLENEGNAWECSPEFIPITWGKRLYLVPADKILEFCIAVNSREVICFVRSDSATEPLTGMPDVPDEFKPYLFEKPIEAQVVAVRESEEPHGSNTYDGTIIFVAINKGSQDGLFPGTTLWITTPDSVYVWVKLTSVTETESEGMIEKRYMEQKRPEVGWLLSTSRPFL